ncbi:MAG: hypothetical protein KGL29_04510 [Alphaproteobacteria bacterium]|nr:hypothetical protein [Alphaproteobacteria bacterium]
MGRSSSREALALISNRIAEKWHYDPISPMVRSEAPARALIAGAVLLLHTVLLLQLLWTNLGQHHRPQLRERTIWLNLQTQTYLRANKRSRQDVLRQPQRLSKQPTLSRSAHAQSIPVYSLPFESDQKNLLGLHDQLFNCAPENLVNLDATQRSRCRKLGALPGYDPNAMDYADHSDKVPGAKRWERELARKNAPLLLPCGSAAGLNPLYTSECILEGVANGFDFKKQYENQPAYFDKPKNLHVDNNGNPPPIYRERTH